ELVNLLPEMNGYANDVDRHHKESVRLQGEISSRQKSLDGVISEREKALANLTTLQNEKESIIQEDIPVVVAELRHTLKPGEPCPVCGSREHLSCEDSAKVENGADRLNDFAAKLRKINGEMEKVQRALDGFATQQQNFEELIRESSQKAKEEADAETSSLELLNSKLEPWKNSANFEKATFESVRGILQNLQSLKTTFLQKKESADGLQNNVNNAAIQRAELVGTLSRIEESLKKAQDKMQELSKELESKLEPWFSNIRMEDLDALLAELEKKNGLWNKAQEKQVKLQGELETFRSNVSQLNENLGLTQSRLDEAKRKIEESRGNLATLENRRKELFGEKSVEEERNKARTWRETAEREADSARRLEQQMREAKIALDKSIADLNSHIADAEPKLAELQKLFLENLTSKSFADEQEFLASKLPESDRKALLQKQKLVDDNLTTAQTSVKNFNDQLAEHQQKRNFEETEEVAKQNRDTAKSKLNECTVNLATWTEQKKTDALKYNRIRCLMAIIACTLLCVVVFFGVCAQLVFNGESDFPEYGWKSYHLFTILSNMLMAVSAAMCIPYAVDGIRNHNYHLPRWYVDLMYMGATSVTITFVIAITILSSAAGFYRIMLWSNNFHLHTLGPLLAITIFFLINSDHRVGFRKTFLAIGPVAAYGLVYIIMVFIIGEEAGGWRDHYQISTVTDYVP
ncbi:MAG: hypothetical protein J6T46_08115, partial [Victivallales bacterium]|nr:hypothetical protein [Victivallales bacterium]